MGSAKKAAKKVSSTPNIKSMIGKALPMADKVTKAIGLNPLGAGQDMMDEVTGKAASKKAEKEAKRKEAKAEAKADKVSGAAEGTMNEAQIARREAEKRGRDVDKVSSERISRGDVRDVSEERVKGAGVQSSSLTGATIDQGPQAQARQTQQTLGAQLAATAAGQGVTPAQLQLQQATEQNIAQQAAARAGTSGAGAALARRDIGRVGAQTAQQGAQQGALLRAQETSAAQQQLGTLSGQMRGQDIGLATGQAGLDQRTAEQNSAQAQQAFLQSSAQEQQAALANAENNMRAQLANQGVDLNVLKDNAARGDAASLANVQSQLQQVGMNDALINAYMQQELGAQGIQAGIANTGVTAAAGGSAAAQAAAGKQQAAGIGALGAFGAAFASDINLKTNIKDGKKSIGDFLSSLAAYDYDYKDEKFGEGKQTSVMAQDLEKTDTGSKAIIETEDGKMVDYTKLLPAMLAGLSDTHKEVMDLKEALKMKKEKK